MVLSNLLSKLFSVINKKLSSTIDPPSFIKHIGKISFTYQDVGMYGVFMNTSRMDAWKYIVNKYNLDRSVILDVGCSYGSWAKNYRDLGFQKLIGIDPNPEAVEQAKEKYDECYLGSTESLVELGNKYNVAAANGVLVHVLEEEQTIKFLRDVKESIEDDGFFLFSVINAKWYYSTGRKETVTEVSCTRFLERYRDYCKQAGLQIIDEVGTFVDPWAVPDLDFLAQEPDLREDWKMYKVFVDLANVIRGRKVNPFSEVLFVTKKSS